MENTKVIGITGGFSSGKSTVGKYISELGYKVIFTDDLAKEIMGGSSEIKEKIRNEFGEQSFAQSGELNREYLAELVFANNQESQKNLEKLDSIVHPAVIDKMIELTELYENDGEECVFIESALIYELDLDEGFDYILCVNSTEENCIKRAIESRHISQQQAEQRLSRQMLMQEKCGLADFVIENNKGIKELKSAVDLVLSFII
jgi:dephospho-CoA kinase